MVYNFGEQLRKGEEGERVLDLALSTFGTIEKVAMVDQKRGIDRMVTAHSGKRMAVEYKTDYSAGRTGNAFIETLSVSRTGKKGWAHTSEADVILYYVPLAAGRKGKPKVYVITPVKLRALLPAWSGKYRTVRCQNEEYHSEGVLVPLAVLGDNFHIIYPIEEQEHDNAPD